MITIVSTKQLPLGSEWEHTVTKRENSFYDYDGNYVPQLSYDIEVNVYHFTGTQCTIPEEVFNILEAEDENLGINTPYVDIEDSSFVMEYDDTFIHDFSQEEEWCHGINSWIVTKDNDGTFHHLFCGDGDMQFPNLTLPTTKITLLGSSEEFPADKFFWEYCKERKNDVACSCYD